MRCYLRCVKNGENMQSTRQLISTGTSLVKPTGITDTTDTTDTKYDNDLLFEQLGDLVNNQFRAWYCKMFFVLGKDNVLKLASVARNDGKDPRKMFSLLLKKGASNAKPSVH